MTPPATAQANVGQQGEHRGWRADCPKCVASKFACDAHFYDAVPDVNLASAPASPEPASNEAPGRGGVENPSALPATDYYPDGSFYGTHFGMSLRDWFAGQALAGLCVQASDGEYFRHTAATAYKQADAMLAARSGAVA